MNAYISALRDPFQHPLVGWKTVTDHVCNTDDRNMGNDYCSECGMSMLSQIRLGVYPYEERPVWSYQFYFAKPFP